MKSLKNNGKELRFYPRSVRIHLKGRGKEEAEEEEERKIINLVSNLFQSREVHIFFSDGGEKKKTCREVKVHAKRRQHCVETVTHHHLF